MKYQVYVSRTTDLVFEIDAVDEQAAKDNFTDGKLVAETDGGYDVPWSVSWVDQEEVQEGETL
jgi:hypothetical protein